MFTENLLIDIYYEIKEREKDHTKVTEI